MIKDLKTQLEGAFSKLEIENKNIDLFIEYIEHLERWNKRINLVSRKETNYVENLIIPSLLFFKIFGENNYNILDIGSGAGIPAVILKMYNPDNNITMVDVNHKKTAFLNFICSELSLKCNIKNIKIESLQHTENLDIITTRGININQPLINLIKKKFKFKHIAHYTSSSINLPLSSAIQINYKQNFLKVYSL